MLAKRGATGILDGPLPEARLDQLEVDETGNAIAATKPQANKQLESKDSQQRPPVDDEGKQRQQTDGRLVDPRGTSVDHFEVPIGVRDSLVHGSSLASMFIC